MFFDDVKLVEEAVAKYGPVSPVFVEAGGLESPTIADYQRTITGMAVTNERVSRSGTSSQYWQDVHDAQRARYLQIHRPLDTALHGYVCEDPGTNGGCRIDQLPGKYPHAIGCLVALSVLEHVEEPWYAPEAIHDSMKPGGLLIVSVPFVFPFHPSPRDYWRFSPDGLRKLFDSPLGGFEVLWCDWRLDIPADAGVLELHSGKPQAIKSCALIARAK